MNADSQDSKHKEVTERIIKIFYRVYDKLARLPLRGTSGSVGIGPPWPPARRAYASESAIALENSQVPESQVWARAKICVLIKSERAECLLTNRYLRSAIWG